MPASQPGQPGQPACLLGSLISLSCLSCFLNRLGNTALVITGDAIRLCGKQGGWLGEQGYPCVDTRPAIDPDKRAIRQISRTLADFLGAYAVDHDLPSNVTIDVHTFLKPRPRSGQ